MTWEIQGHRGARGLYPENTLEGFRRTVALGVDAIELDVGISADDVAVVFHDHALHPDIVRDCDGSWSVPADARLRSLTLAALQRFDVGRLRPGSAYERRFPEQVPHDGSRIPTLRQVLRVLADAGVRADIELKSAPLEPELAADAETMTRIVLADVAAERAVGAVDLRSFDWRALRIVRARLPAVPLTYLTSAQTTADPQGWWGRALDRSVPRTVAAEQSGATWAPEHTDLTQAAVTEAHALGLRVIPWTVNEPADMRRLVSWGVDGICTDRPDLALAVRAGAT